MTQRRDSQRLASYQAEDHAFTGTAMATPIDFSAASRLIHDVIAHAWWRKRGCDTRPVTVRLGRSASTSWFRADDRRFQLSPAGLQVCTVTHELAHAGDTSQNEASHGPTFRRVHVDVVALVAGRVPASQLEDSYRGLGLTVGPAHPLSAIADAVTILDPRPFNDEQSTLILQCPPERPSPGAEPTRPSIAL